LAVYGKKVNEEGQGTTAQNSRATAQRINVGKLRHPQRGEQRALYISTTESSAALTLRESLSLPHAHTRDLLRPSPVYAPLCDDVRSLAQEA